MLEKILGVSWNDNINYDDLYLCTDTCSMEHTLAQRHIRWLGHNVKPRPHDRTLSASKNCYHITIRNGDER